MLECAGQCLKMEKSCSFISCVSTIPCGEGRSGNDVVKLRDCVEDISIHLGSCHLSKSGLPEFELILIRAGIFDISPDQLETINDSLCKPSRKTW